MYLLARHVCTNKQQNTCETCRELDSSMHAMETLMPHEVTSRPWEKITTDIFTLDGKDYQVTIDYYSNF